MISTAQALDAALALVAPMPVEEIPLAQAFGRVLAKPVTASRAQPPFAASAMDGYIVATRNVSPGDQFRTVGEAAAGHGYDGTLGPSDAVRIFTGAPVPKGGLRVIIQEDVTRDGDIITVQENLDAGFHVRPAGGDFDIGTVLDAPCHLTAAKVALLASMNCAFVKVYRKPVIAILATGDELALPGEDPRSDQIIASNSFGLNALFRAAGAETRMLPIAKDTLSSLTKGFELAAGADLVVTIGGASVGDHDIVAQTAADLGLERAFYKVAMRPGKPLMAGRLGTSAMIGLPGNPVSSMVCAEIFILPAIYKMLGLPFGPRTRETAKLAHAVEQNGPREHYMRARLTSEGRVEVFDRQDSSLMSVLADADVLVVRAPHASAALPGDDVDIIHLTA